MEQTTTPQPTSHDSHSSPKQLTPPDAAVLAPCFEPSPARPAGSQTTGRQWLAPLLRAPIRATALPTNAASNLSLSSLYALPKHSGRAGLFSRCHWYPVGGLLLVLAHSRPAFRNHTCSLWLPPRTNSNPSHLCLHQCPLAIVMRCETTTHRKMHHDLQ